MKKLMILSLFFLCAACGNQPSSSGKKDPDCKCTHTECPCPNSCDHCSCNYL